MMHKYSDEMIVLEAAILYLTRPRISGMAAAIENVGAAIVQWRRPTNGRRHFTGTRDLTRLKKCQCIKMAISFCPNENNRPCHWNTSAS